MNKFIFLTFLLGIFFNSVYSQPVITSDDMPDSNDTFRLSFWTPQQGTNPFDFSVTGPASTWDFTWLSSEEQEIDTFFSPLQTPPSYNFVFTNPIIYPDNFAQLAQRSQSLPQQPGGGGGGGGGGQITFSDAYDFLKKNNTEYAMVGNAFKLNDIPSANAFDQNDVIYRFPLKYDDNFSSPSRYNILIPEFIEYYHRQIRTTVVDGWGRLFTPKGEYEVIRVKSEIVATDSIIFLQAPIVFPFVVPSTTIEYKWLANGLAVPALHIVTRTGSGFGPGGNQLAITRVAYFDTAPPGNYIWNSVQDQNANDNHSIVFPNPIEDVSFINPQLEGKIVVRDLTGKILFESEDSVEVKDFFQTASNGVYYVMCGNKTQKLVKA